MKRKKGVGVPKFRGKVIAWVFGRLSRTGGRSLTKGLNLGWETVRG